jgi:hypothetical protein
LLSDVPEFVSEEIVGNGAPQVTAHGFPGDPSRVRVVPVKWAAGSACDFTASSDVTNVTVTMTSGVTYVIMAWPPVA